MKNDNLDRAEVPGTDAVSSAARLGVNIKNLRTKKRMNTRLLADLSGIAPSVLTDIETGVTQNPRLFTAINVARALGTTLSVLLEGDLR